MTGQSCGQDAVEHIDAARDAVDQVFGRADTHQVTRLVIRQERSNQVQSCMHLCFGLADRQSADGDPWARQAGDEHRRLCPQY